MRFSQLSVAMVLMASTVWLQGCEGQAQEGFAGFPPPEVSVLTLAPHDVAVSYEYVGQTIASREVTVLPRINAALMKVLFNEGQMVKAGEALYQLDAAPFEAKVQGAEAVVAAANTRLNQAQRELNRLQPLAVQSAVSKQVLDAAQTELDAANANLMAAKAALREAKLALGYSQIVAPFSGFVGMTAKYEGAWLNAGQTELTTISQLDPIQVLFAIPEHEALKRIQDVANGSLTWPEQSALNVTIKLADGTMWPHQGKVDFTAAGLKDGSGSIQYRASIANPEGVLKAGQFAKVVLQGGVRPNALFVPQTAVLESPHGKFVYVTEQTDAGLTAAFRPVQLGEWQAIDGVNMWRVISGLNAGDEVILDNLIKVRPGAPVTVATSPAAAASSAKAE